MKQRLVILLLTIVCISSFNNATHLKSIGKGKMPAVTTDSQKNIHVVFGSGDSLLYSKSSDRGRTFSQPLLIEKIDGLNAAATRGPQIISIDNNLCIVATSSDGRIYSWVKNKNDHWKRSAMVSDKDSVALEGFVSLSGDGLNAFAVWLDLRNNGRNKIYGARSADGGNTWSENMLIYQSPDSTVCECCKPSVVVKGSRVNVMFRNWLNGNRDMYLVSSSDGGKSFGNAEKLGNGKWALNGCPMDGGGIAVNDNGIINSVWRREQNIYSCQPGDNEIRLGEGKSCVIAAVEDKFAYAWTLNKEIICVLPDGQHVKPGKGNTVQLAPIDKNNLLCIWENDGMILSNLIQN